MLTPAIPMSPPQRRIEDRIRELCARAISATDDDLARALQELSQLLHRTVEHMRVDATSLLVEETSAGTWAASPR